MSFASFFRDFFVLSCHFSTSFICAHTINPFFIKSTEEYQGLDPDVRGPFPPSVFGSGVKIIPT